MQKLVCAVAAAVCLSIVGAAHADTVDSLTLKSTMGNSNGTGTLDLSGLLNASGLTTYSEGAYVGSGKHSTSNPDVLEGLSLSVDGYDFTLSNDSEATVTFTSGGELSALDYNGSDGDFAVDIDLDINDSLDYTLTEKYFGGLLGSSVIDAGTISIDPPMGAAVTPEPPSLALLGMGLTAVCGLVRRRRVA